MFCLKFVEVNMKKSCLYVAFLLCTLVNTLPARTTLPKRWVYVSDNLYVNENVKQLEQLLKRAQKAGYNGVLFTDYKTFTWWQLGDAQRWRKNAQKLRSITKELQMELVVCVFPFGYAGSLLWHDVNLASGMSVKKAPLKVAGGYLEPTQTAQIINSSFEEHENHKALHYNFQDDIGKGSFIDREIKKDGKISIRFENVGDVNQHGHGRICQEVKVLPWQQYRIRAWMKTEDLTGGEIKIIVLADGRVLQWQHLQFRQGDRLRYINQVQNLTTDWVEQCVTFNSLENDSVLIYMGMWGGRKGKIWWDDLRIEAVPALNIIRRDSLPIEVVGEDGTTYQQGLDYEPIIDLRLGKLQWAGSYDTHHDPPRIVLTEKTRIKPNETVFLSCYHPTLVYSGQVNCSLSEPKVFELCKQQIENTEDALQPDGYLMSHDEIRCAGWEPDQTKKFKSSGQLLAYNIKTCYQIIRDTVGNKPVYLWSDMFDPHHNAHENYYLVNNTFTGSWEGLDNDIVIMKWGGGERAKPGLQFFSDRGHSQMVAAYYDGDVQSDGQMWKEAMKQIPDIIGIMYTTWQNDYSDLEKFASVWWD
jgi:hypothetical protein